MQRDFVRALYDERRFLRSLADAMSDCGVLVSQVGIAPKMYSPSDNNSINSHRAGFVSALVEIGFEHVRDFEEVRKNEAGDAGNDLPVVAHHHSHASLTTSISMK